MRFLLVFGAIVGASFAFAERPHYVRTDSSILRSQTPRVNVPATFTGIFEFRPTWGTRHGNFSTENFYEFSWWLKPNQRVTFGETFFTQPTANKIQEMMAGDGYVRYQLREFVKNEKTGLTVSSEFRANLPISSRSRDAGMITALRSTLLLAIPITHSTRFEFRETPIFYLYKEAGHQGPSGAISHAVFENRVTIGPVISFSPNLTLVAPLNFCLTRFRNYQAEASHNNEWFPDVSFTPELDWSVTSSSYLGFAYRTEGLMVRDRAGMILNNNPGGGSMQMVFGLSF